MSSSGIDVSNNNGKLTVANLGLQSDFIFAKASDGSNFTDQDYTWYSEQAAMNRAGHFGAYHFFHAERLDARAEAMQFVNCAKPRSKMSLWVDYETYGVNGQTDAQQLGFFISYVKVMVPKAKVGIYCNLTGFNRISPFFHEIPFNGFWYAAPSIPMTSQPLSLKWQFHQYAEKNGVDINYSTMTAAQMNTYWTWK